MINWQALFIKVTKPTEKEEDLDDETDLFKEVWEAYTARLVLKTVCAYSYYHRSFRHTSRLVEELAHQGTLRIDLCVGYMMDSGGNASCIVASMYPL